MHRTLIEKKVRGKGLVKLSESEGYVYLTKHNNGELRYTAKYDPDKDKKMIAADMLTHGFTSKDVRKVLK